MKEVCGTSDRETGWGTWSRSTSSMMTAGRVGSAIGLSERPVSMRETVMSQQSVRQAARRAALDAQAVRRKDRAERERRLEVLAVEVLTAIGERDRAVRDAEKARRGGVADNGRRRGTVGARGRRLVRQRHHQSGGSSAAPPCTGPAQRRRLSARRVSAVGLAASHEGGGPSVGVAGELLQSTAVGDASGADVNCGGGEAMHIGE
jgi:hypothetical protein